MEIIIRCLGSQTREVLIFLREKKTFWKNVGGIKCLYKLCMLLCLNDCNLSQQKLFLPLE